MLINVGLSTGGRVVNLSESGGASQSLVVTVEGSTLYTIPITIIPLSYDEFEARYSRLILDEIFPTRPIDTATGYTPHIRVILYVNHIAFLLK